MATKAKPETKTAAKKTNKGTEMAKAKAKGTFNHPDPRVQKASHKATIDASEAVMRSYELHVKAHDGDSPEARRKATNANHASNRAQHMTNSVHSGTEGTDNPTHQGAEEAHYEAAKAHDEVAAHYEEEGDDSMAEKHSKVARMHGQLAATHAAIHRKTQTAKPEAAAKGEHKGGHGPVSQFAGKEGMLNPRYEIEA